MQPRELPIFAVQSHRMSPMGSQTPHQGWLTLHSKAQQKEDQLTFWYFGWSSRGSSTEGCSCSRFIRCMYGKVPATAMC